MLVLKLEHEDGSSIFVDDNTWLDNLPYRTRLRVCTHRPNPFEEGLRMEYGRHICGFVSVKQLRKWFTLPALKCMARHGIHLVQYDVPDEAVQVAKAQCIFVRYEAKRQAKVHLWDFLTELKRGK